MTQVQTPSESILLALEPAPEEKSKVKDFPIRRYVRQRPHIQFFLPSGETGRGDHRLDHDKVQVFLQQLEAREDIWMLATPYCELTRDNFAATTQWWTSNVQISGNESWGPGARWDVEETLWVVGPPDHLTEWDEPKDDGNWFRAETMERMTALGEPEYPPSTSNPPAILVVPPISRAVQMYPENDLETNAIHCVVVLRKFPAHERDIVDLQEIIEEEMEAAYLKVITSNSQEAEADRGTVLVERYFVTV